MDGIGYILVLQYDHKSLQRVQGPIKGRFRQYLHTSDPEFPERLIYPQLGTQPEPESNFVGDKSLTADTGLRYTVIYCRVNITVIQLFFGETLGSFPRHDFVRHLHTY